MLLYRFASRRNSEVHCLHFFQKHSFWQLLRKLHWWWWHDMMIWYGMIWYDMIWHDDHMIWYDDDYIIWSLYFCCRHPSSVVSAVVVVLRPSSVPSVRRRRRPSSSSSVRPSVPSVRRRRLPANPRPHANFRKLIKIEVPRPRDYEIRNLREKCSRFLRSKLKKVPGKYVLWMIYFSI